MNEDLVFQRKPFYDLDNYPQVKHLSISNVYCRLMHFKKGNIMQGHKHNYDHATLVSSGSIQVDMMDEDANILSSKIFVAPNMIFVRKDKYHRLTALEDNTVAVCIHAMRTIDEDIVPSDFLMECDPKGEDNSYYLNEFAKAKLNKELNKY